LEGEAARTEPHFPHDQPPSHMAAAEDESLAAEGMAEGDMEADLGDEEPEAAGAARADHGNGDGRRRRRRGRRGGRRSRREDDDIGISPPESDVPPIDEEIAHAVADFGGPPIEQERDHRPHEPDRVAADRSDHPHHEAPTPEPAPATASEPVAPPKAESPRRRSTVREPAPLLIGGAAPAVATTVVEGEPTEPPPPAQPPAEATERAAPRRAGWWAKRMLGDKR
jgi:ribonuclease E